MKVSNNASHVTSFARTDSGVERRRIRMDRGGRVLLVGVSTGGFGELVEDHQQVVVAIRAGIPASA
jgi:hypothetical protein